MAAPASDALASALGNRQFDQIARLLDAMELEVWDQPQPVALRVCSEAHLWALVTCFALCALQSLNPAVLLEWPHALHLLGHMYNHSL